MAAYYTKPQIPNKKVKWLWWDDYYDGPLCGMTEIKGQRFWAIMKTTKLSVLSKDYAIYQLSKKRQDYEERKHELWLKCWEVEQLINTYDAYKFYWAMTKESDLVFGKKRGKLVGWFKMG